MKMKRHLGIILMILGVFLTINQGQDNQNMWIHIKEFIKIYWPLLLCYLGIYMISSPKKK